MNYNAKKLTDFSVVKIFIMANLCKSDSLRKIAIGIRSKPALQEEIGMTLIRGRLYDVRMVRISGFRIISQPGIKLSLQARH